MTEKRAAKVSTCDTCNQLAELQLVMVRAPYEPKVEDDVWPTRYEEHFLCEKCLRLLRSRGIRWRLGGMSKEQAAQAREEWQTESKKAKNPPFDD